MARLAMLAVLLMALAPSVSRVFAAGTTQVLEGWTELCTTAGLAWVDTAAQSPVKKSPQPAGMPADADCAYCPLASSLPLVLLVVCLLFPRVAAGKATTFDTGWRRVETNRRGLGSQGPPIRL